jgi:hypothetical protein
VAPLTAGAERVVCVMPAMLPATDGVRRRA